MKNFPKISFERDTSLKVLISDFAVAVAFIAFCYVVSLLFAPQANAQTSTSYKGGYQQQSSVIKAQVVSVRDVVLSGETSQTGQYVGQAIGGTVGALLGQRSGNYAVAGLVSTLATMAGGIVGSGIGSDQAAQEVILNMPDGRMVAITQSVGDGVRFVQGQQVMVIGTGRLAPL
ncbi:hypothetical protein LP417_35115 (plasmid) [Polaromonas sp. P1-6]|nr:hypothetical protein LP417_35115 [Polaromonas sp. P1-6]